MENWHFSDRIKSSLEYKCLQMIGLLTTRCCVFFQTELAKELGVDPLQTL